MPNASLHVCSPPAAGRDPLWREVSGAVLREERRRQGRTLADVAGRAGRWWLVVDSDDVEVCDFDPGYDVAAEVRTDLRTLTELWRCDTDWPTALANERVTIVAETQVRRQIPQWIGHPDSSRHRDHESRQGRVGSAVISAARG